MEQLLKFQNYLVLLASSQLRQMQELRLEPMDIVQETFARAHQHWEQYAGEGDRELAGWLRSILTNYLRDLLRRQGRELDEQQLRNQLDESSMRIERWLACNELTPRRIVLKQERMLNLVNALGELPDSQRRALELRFLDGCTVEQICQHMQRTPASVGGLLQRGLATLRQRIDEL